MIRLLFLTTLLVIAIAIVPTLSVQGKPKLIKTDSTAKQGEYSRFVGKWRIVEVTLKGQPIPDIELRQLQNREPIRITSGRIPDLGLRFELDLSQTPQQNRFILKSGDLDQVRERATYQWDEKISVPAGPERIRFNRFTLENIVDVQSIPSYLRNRGAVCGAMLERVVENAVTAAAADATSSDDTADAVSKPNASPSAVSKEPVAAVEKSDPAPSKTTKAPLNRFGGNGWTGGGALFGDNLPPLPPQAMPSKNYVTSKNLVIAISDKRDRVWGYSRQLGKWTTLAFDTPFEQITPIVSQNIGCLFNGTMPSDKDKGRYVWGYSVTTGNWDKLTLSTGSAAIPSIHEDMILVEDGKQIHIFSDRSGKWAAPPKPDDEVAPIQGDPVVGSRIGLPGPPQLGGPRPTQRSVATAKAATDPSHRAQTLLKDQYEAQERQAAAIARQIRDNSLPSADLKTKLRQAVVEAFGLRQQLHRAELAAFQQRMAKVEQTIRTRDELKERIIERRVEDLLNPNLDWDSTPQPKAALTSRPTDLEGEWSLESINGGGVISHEEGLKLRIRGQQWITLRGEHEAPYSIAVDSAANPKTIDLITAFPDGRPPRIEKGIYSLRGDVLTVSFAPVGSDRPTEFDGEKYAIQTWKRSSAADQTVQFRITSPEGAAIVWLDEPAVQTGGLTANPVLPLRHNLTVAKTHRLQVSDIPSHPGWESLVTIEIPVPSAQVRDHLRNNALPLQFTDEDLQQARAGNQVVKVIYLPHPEFQKLALPSVETMVNTRTNPGIDVVDEARQRGTVLAIVRMSTSNSTAEPPRSDGRLILKDVQDFQRRFLEAEHLVESNRQLVSDARAALAAGTGTQAAIDANQKLVDDSLKKLDLVRSAYQAQISGLEQNIRLAKQSLELAEAEYKQSLQANRLVPGTVAQKELQRLKLAQAAANVEIDHATVLLELYRKIAPASETGSETIGAAENLLWEYLGLRLKTIDAQEATSLPKYYGGLRVVEVRADSPGAKAKIKVGDILVGLAKWETRTPDHAVFAIRNHSQVSTPDGKESLRFYISRNGAIVFGDLEKPVFPQDPANKPAWLVEPRSMTYSFKVDSEYWSGFLHWLARTTNRGVQVDVANPDGRFTYATKEPLRIDEILDVMNAELKPQGLQVTITDTEIHLRKKDPVKDANAREQAKTNLRILMKALNQYHDQHQHFPPATILGQDGKGTVPHSWRVEILPYLGQQKLYDEYRFDETWDSETNKSVLAKMPAVFRSPLDKPDSQNSSYFGLVTPGFKPQQNAGLAGGAAISDGRPPIALRYDFGTVFSNPRGTTYLDIHDGTANTVVLVEAQRAVAWTKPEDIPYSADQPLPILGGWFPEGWHAAFAEGSVKLISSDNPESTIRALFTIGGGENVKPQTVEAKLPTVPAATSGTAP